SSTRSSESFPRPSIACSRSSPRSNQECRHACQIDRKASFARPSFDQSIGRASRAMIKPDDLESEEGRLTWATITAAAAGDVAALRQLLDQNPQLSRAAYWYTPAVHFAVREGHAEAVQLLLDAGADPEWNGYHDGSLVEMARERGHEGVARLLEDARQRMGRVAPVKDHPIHRAAQSGDLERVREI